MNYTTEDKKILVIQTAFIGDAILATSLLENLHQLYPNAKIDFLIRKGNQHLFVEHPFINKLLIWDKTENKYKSWLKILKDVRETKYDILINLQRFFSMGLLSVLSNSKQIIGFSKNPLSAFFTKSITHKIDKKHHEVNRNHLLISHLTKESAAKPKIYPSEADMQFTIPYKKSKYICVAPNSVWFTKQLPVSKWIELLNLIPNEFKIYLLGAPSEFQSNEVLLNQSNNKNIENLAGKLNLLQSAALIQDAEMNYVNDSGPLHLATATNAPTTAFFCSTVPSFGFGPLADNSIIIETNQNLDCRPCGLHGKKACPQEHFACGKTIEIKEAIDRIS